MNRTKLAVIAACLMASIGAARAETAPYTVMDGNKVDAGTLKGWRAWRAGACDRCHGPSQEGLVGPSLVNSLKVLTEEDFMNTVVRGRMEIGMPSFAGNMQVMENIMNLYAYLKGRSDGAIKPGRLEAIEGNPVATEYPR